MRLKTPQDYGLVIRENRRKLKMTQQALADTVGVGRQWIIAVEQGKAGAELGLVLRTLQILGVHIALAVSETEQAVTQVHQGVPETALRNPAPEPDETPGTNLGMTQAAALPFVVREGGLRQ